MLNRQHLICRCDEPSMSTISPFYKGALRRKNNHQIFMIFFVSIKHRSILTLQTVQENKLDCPSGVMREWWGASNIIWPHLLACSSPPSVEVWFHPMEPRTDCNSWPTVLVLWTPPLKLIVGHSMLEEPFTFFHCFKWSTSQTKSGGRNSYLV